ELSVEALAAEIGGDGFDVLAVDPCREGALLPALLDRLDLDLADVLARADEGCRDEQAGDLFAGEEGEVEPVAALDSGPFGVVGEDRLDDPFVEAPLAEDRHSRFRVLIERRMDLPVPVVEQAGEAPDLGVLAQLFGVPTHGRFDR